MGALRQKLRAAWALCLAPLVGVGCGDPSLSAGVERPATAITTSAHTYDFAPIKAIKLADRGPRCATLWVGGVIWYISCFDVDHLPQEVFADTASGVIILAVDSGDIVSFPDPSVRVLSTSEHYVAAQLSTELPQDELKFTITSAQGARRCAMDRILFLHCR